MSVSRRPSLRGLRLAATLLLLAGAVGCSATTSRNPFVQANPSESRLTLYAENRGFNDIRLYSLTARGTESLGVVSGNGQRRINLPWRQLDQISFRIEVLAGRTYNTPAVSVSPGDRIQLVIPDDPSNTYIQVR